MENNEIMVNEEIEVIENAELIEAQDTTEVSDGAVGKAVLLVGGIALIGAAATAVVKFTKKMRTDYKIKSLEKQGYKVYKSEEIEAIEEPVVDDDEEVIEVDE